jgi:hypothetical protein
MRLADTTTRHLPSVVSGMLGKRTNAYVEAMNGLLQQVKRAARGFPHCQELHRYCAPLVLGLRGAISIPYEVSNPTQNGVESNIFNS